jgi:phosphatidylserine/phosphatidylglycerophosphate/cardiolipin synthase-like enzyme
MTRYLHFILPVLIFVSCASKKGKYYQAKSAIPKETIQQSLSLLEDLFKTKTAVYTLENGGKSLAARLWLIENAQKSIDLQYFSFAKDITGLIACDEIIRAADRGVKVRIIIDDAASKMYSHEVKLLESHENIDIRVYNAGVMLGRPDRRAGKLARNINRLLRRMHNKTFTVDGIATILGGRNIADDYFDYHHKYNFRDRDVLIFGNSVQQVTSSFEKFWNHELTIPYSELSKKVKKKRYQDSLRFEHIHKKAATTKKFSNQTRERIKDFPTDIKKAVEERSLSWIQSANFISDVPGKNSEIETRKGGVATDSIEALIRSAKKSLLINTPYFIPTPELKQLLLEALQRGVKIRLLTNSLASTDQPAAFSAYKKTRKEFINAGIELYEFKPNAAERYEIMIPDIQQKKQYKAVFGFHSKTFVIDDQTVVIGSYNLDPRSADYNTECIAVFRSTEVSKNLSKYIEQEFLPANSWQITPTSDPDSKASFIKRIKACVFYLVPRKLL